MPEVEVKKGKRKVLKPLFTLACVSVLAYLIAERQRPSQCIPARDVRERLLIRNEDGLSGLGSIFSALISDFIKEEGKIRLLESLFLTLAIEPVEERDNAVTITFSDGYCVIEPGVSPSFDIKITCDYETLLMLAKVGWGIDALRFLLRDEGKILAEKLRKGELKVQGALFHPVSLLRFAKFLSPVENT